MYYTDLYSKFITELRLVQFLLFLRRLYSLIRRLYSVMTLNTRHVGCGVEETGAASPASCTALISRQWLQSLWLVACACAFAAPNCAAPSALSWAQSTLMYLSSLNRTQSHIMYLDAYEYLYSTLYKYNREDAYRWIRTGLMLRGLLENT